MIYNLFIDDEREPSWRECVKSGVDPSLPWLVTRSSREAIEIVKLRGMPARLALDHDLGIVFDKNREMTMDTVPVFLKWLANEYWNGTDPIPEYTIHTGNPVGHDNMESFMQSWIKSAKLP